LLFAIWYQLSILSSIFAVAMKKYLLIFLALQILATSGSANLGVSSMIKVSAFFHHYVHHISCEQEDLSILEFIRLHYTDNEHLATDHAEHDKLPFHCPHTDQHHIAAHAAFLIPQVAVIVTFTRTEITTQTLISESQELHYAFYLGNIWEPPKV
jgi:hypothetical protein